MNFDEITQQFLILQNSTDPQEQANANTFIVEFIKRPECLQWILATYPTMNNKQIRLHQLIWITQWCKSQNENIPQDIFGSFRELLFAQQIPDEFKDENFINVLAYCQVSFVWKVFPLQWPTFWTDFFSTDDDQSQLQFLLQLTKYASILLGRDNFLYTKIKDNMRINATDKLITDFIIRKMEQQNPNAFEIFSYLCTWVNTNYLVPAQNLIKAGLAYPELSNFSLSILSELVSRGMPADVKLELIKSFDIPNQINNLIQSNPNDVISIAAASLIDHAGEEVIKTPDADSYFNLALKFLAHPKTDISVIVFPFLILLCKYNKLTSPIILMKAIERLSLFVGIEIGESFDEVNTSYLDQISRLIHFALKADPDKNYGELLNAWNNETSILGTNPNLAVSIIFAVGNSITSGEKSPQKQQFISDFIVKFSVILQAQPPINKVFSFGIIQFLNFFIVVYNNFSIDQISYVFDFVCRFSLLKQENGEFHENITKVLYSYIKKLDPNHKSISFDPQIIQQFIETGEEQLVAAAGLLIQSIKQELQSQVFDQCMNHLQETLNHIEESQRLRFVSTILSFIKSLNYSKDAPHLAYVINFLQGVFAPCATDDEIFAFFIRTAYSSLEENSFQIIYNCLDKISADKIKSCLAFCDTASTLISRKDVPKDKWVTEIINHLFSIVIPLFGSINWDIVIGKGEASNEVLNLTCLFIKLFSNTLGLEEAPRLIDPQVYVSMKVFVTQTLNNHFDIAALVDALIVLLDHIVKIDPVSVFDELGNLAMNFLYTSSFKPVLKPWKNVCESLMNFHLTLIKIDQGKAGALILNSFRAFIDNEQQFNEVMTAYYNILMEARPRDRRSKGRDFFNNFSKYLAAKN